MQSGKGRRDTRTIQEIRVNEYRFDVGPQQWTGSVPAVPTESRKHEYWAIATPSLEDRIAAQGTRVVGGSEAARRAFVERQPLGRLGAAEEVAELFEGIELPVR